MSSTLSAPADPDAATDVIATIVAAAPPLSEATRARLSALLAGGNH